MSGLFNLGGMLFMLDIPKVKYRKGFSFYPPSFLYQIFVMSGNAKAFARLG